MPQTPIHCFERKQPPQQTELQDREKKKQRERKKNLLCRLCGEVITSENNRVSINGAHINTRQNPSNVTFTFACFDTAPGCRAWGSATQEHTWFPGYYWQIALCAGCGEHLGWSFKNSSRFYGLIIERLTDNDT